MQLGDAPDVKGIHVAFVERTHPFLQLIRALAIGEDQHADLIPRESESVLFPVLVLQVKRDSLPERYSVGILLQSRGGA